jgi:hypothetical protein
MNQRDDTSLAKLRIDAPHARQPLARAAEVPAMVAAGVAADSETSASRGELVAYQPGAEILRTAAGEADFADAMDEVREQRLHQQAAQIAAHLRERLAEVSRREAQHYARVAQLESEARASKLWVREREHDFHEREAELRQQLAESAASTDQASERVDRTAELAAWEQRLREREQSLQVEFEQQVRKLQQQHQARQQELDAMEAVLNEHAVRLERDRADFGDELQQWKQSQREQQAALAQRIEITEATLHERRGKAAQREGALAKQQAALEELRGELLGVHRQSLEMRLIAEQLWSQTSGRLAPAEMTRSIAQHRLQLAEQYRLEERTLAEQKQEIVALGQRLAAQHDAVQKQRDELRSWTAARQAEIEAQAERLVAREFELDSQQAEHRTAQAAWSAERREFERQIRQLTRCLRHASVAEHAHC